MAHQAGTLDIFERDVGAKVWHNHATVASPARRSGGGTGRQDGLKDQPHHLGMRRIDHIARLGFALRVVIDQVPWGDAATIETACERLVSLGTP
jgi:hypothetical protein